MLILMFFAFLAGIALATQASLNAHLGQLLSSPILATLITFSSASLMTGIYVLSTVEKYPHIEEIKNVPVFLWFTSGILSAIAMALFYFLIPKIGILPLISFSLAGQLLFSVIVGHFGFFNFPITPIDNNKIIGVTSMILAIYLINKG